MTASAGENLAARGLACIRGERLVFRDVEFSVAGGEALRLTGPNGSGKSSLLRLIAGFGRPAAGTLRWNGADIELGAWGGRERGLLYLGHQDAVKPWLTVGENLAFWAALNGAAVAASVAPALARLGLGAHAAAPARYLSAGQRRRLALARLAAIPALLWLLDEPTTALDDASVGVVESLIAEHCKGGGMAVVSTHAALALPGSLGLELGAAA